MRVCMQRIDPPVFAPKYALIEEASFYDGVTLSNYQQIQRYRDALLAAAHAAVEAYLDQCALDDPELFPFRGALTGEYYLERHESYGRENSTGRVKILLAARCLGLRPQRSSTPIDYCGVDMTLVFDLDDGRFETFYTGHHVI